MATKIESFNKTTCRDVAARIQQALQPLADELGVVISHKGGSFSPGSYTCKIEVATRGEDGAVCTREASAFKLYAPINGLSPDDLGRSFAHGGRTYVITGFRAKAWKRPICATSGGKSFGFPIDVVKALLKAAS